jgi:putative nucleotidyltransferase with HDIG domain
MHDLEYIEEVLHLADPEERQERFRNDERLRRLLPEVYLLEGVPQPPDHHPEGDAFVHTLLAVKLLPPRADRRLAWAALLHDIGKATTTRELDGRVRAFGHDREGERLAETILERLGMNRKEQEEILWLIRHHMFALSWRVVSLHALSRRQWRFIRDERFPLLLDLLEIDARAAGANAEKLSQVDFYRHARQSIDAGAPRSSPTD